MSAASGSIALVGGALELARWQFALTTLFHFVFVPLTLGLVPFLAVLQTLAHRRPHERERWERLTRFFGALFLVNFAIGAATGLVQEFQFGMSWSVFSETVGDVFGSPLAIEGLGAFMLESTFIGLWVFGRDRLSPRVHLATIYLVWLGTWASAYFIIAANSWMQHPVGYELDPETGAARANDILAILFQRFAVMAWGHAILAALTTGAFVVLGVACWHLLRRRNQELFLPVARLALWVALPVATLNLLWGSELGVVVTDAQPMKIAATEALWETEQPAGFSLVQIGGFTQDDQTPSFEIEIPYLLSLLATNSLDGEVVGMNELQAADEAQYGPGSYVPDVRLVYWSMRAMAYLGTLLVLVALWGTWLARRGRLETAHGFHRVALVAIAFPFLSNFAGWILTEAGRQPWVVYGLLRTEDAVSPLVGTGTVALSLTVFVTLYAVLGALDFVLMRRFARLDPPTLEPDAGAGELPPRGAPGY